MRLVAEVVLIDEETLAVLDEALDFLARDVSRLATLRPKLAAILLANGWTDRAWGQLIRQMSEHVDLVGPEPS